MFQHPTADVWGEQTWIQHDVQQPEKQCHTVSAKAKIPFTNVFRLLEGIEDQNCTSNCTWHIYGCKLANLLVSKHKIKFECKLCKLVRVKKTDTLLLCFSPLFYFQLSCVEWPLSHHTFDSVQSVPSHFYSNLCTSSFSLTSIKQAAMMV